MANMNLKSEGITHAHPLLKRLTSVANLSSSDVTALMNAQRNRLKVRAGADLVLRGQPLESTYVVQSGWLILNCLIDDGRRQIYSLALPGDVICEFSPYGVNATYNVTALTDAEVAAIKPKSFMGIQSESQALAFALGTNRARHNVILGDQILRLGRLSAYERHCHLMLELMSRCEEAGEVSNGWMEWPLKQVDLADILGLSLVHVNRTIMQMKRDGIITLEKRRLRLNDRERMAEISGFDQERILTKAA